MHVLIVDDEPDIRTLFEAMVSAAGHTVTSVPDGQAALATIGVAAPDVVLLDIMMPGMDGFEVLGALRADTATASLPVIMVTALADDAVRERALQSGASDFVTKPTRAAQLLQAIADAAVSR